MAKTKNILLRSSIAALGMIGLTLWANVTLQPIYSETRFEPADKLHAWCTNDADLLFSPQGKSVKKISMVLTYNPDTMEILRIMPAKNIWDATSKIEYDKIILEVNEPNLDTAKNATTLFQITFRSATIGKEMMLLDTGSEAIIAGKNVPLKGTFALDFAKVPECEPDIVPPSISLIYPKDTKQRISLDQYFVFDIKDIGKWVDKNSVTISFWWEDYFYGSESLKRNGNYLTFYPGKRIPIDTNMNLKILVTDKQSYGWANKAQSIYNFQSATWMAFNKDISPLIFRQIAQEAAKVSATQEECTALAERYANAQQGYMPLISSIIQKAWCNLSEVNTSLLTSHNGQMNDEQKNQYIHLSVFWTLWRILFFIAFTLKMHYFFAYRKHKRIVKRLKNNG